MSSVCDCCNCSCFSFFGSNSTSRLKIPHAKGNYGSFDSYEISPNRITDLNRVVFSPNNTPYWAHLLCVPHSASLPIYSGARGEKMRDENSSGHSSSKGSSPIAYRFSAPSHSLEQTFNPFLQTRRDLGCFYFSCPGTPLCSPPKNSD